MISSRYDVIIAGGGLAGLTSAILLGKAGMKTLLIEKKNYPFHKVCGEYVSNEVRGFLNRNNIFPENLGAFEINRLRVSAGRQQIRSKLNPGGFGMSRYILDHEFYKTALEYSGILTGTKVNGISFSGNEFTVRTDEGKTFSSSFILGSYGKRESLDRKLNRKFFMNDSLFSAVKYHIRTSYPVNEIGLDFFNGGYCGIVKIEEDKYSLCYLVKTGMLKEYGNPANLELNISRQSPALAKILNESEKIRKKPEVISQLSFAKKELVSDHIWMLGDSAGVISPLCGNGMSMAITAANEACRILIKNKIHKKEISFEFREQLEKEYSSRWRKKFAGRLTAGRVLQSLMLNKNRAAITLGSLSLLPPVTRWIISKTHGKKLD